MTFIVGHRLCKETISTILVSQLLCQEHLKPMSAFDINYQIGGVHGCVSNCSMEIIVYCIWVV